MIYDEELKRLHDWLQSKGEHPSVVLALRWIEEFEAYADQDEEDLMEFVAFLKSWNHPKAASVLRHVAEFEETVEPDTRLMQLHDWLQAKGDDPTAVLARWWITEFEESGKKRTALKAGGTPSGQCRRHP